MTHAEKAERNLKILKDYESGMEIADILIKYKLSNIMHILNKFDTKRGRYRNFNGMCSNHPDRKATFGKLCDECKTNYMRDWRRNKRTTKTKEVVNFDLTPAEQRIKERLKNFDSLNEIGKGMNISLNDIEINVNPTQHYNSRLTQSPYNY